MAQQDGQMTADLDKRGRALGIVDWPYGVHTAATQQAMLDWADACRLRYSQAGRCLHWIARGRCGVGLCREGRSAHRWMDHLTGWTRAGAPAVLIAQPYDLSSDDITDLATVAGEYSVDVHINGTGWYGHGSTFVQLWRPGAWLQTMT